MKLEYSAMNIQERALILIDRRCKQYKIGGKEYEIRLQ